MHRRRGFAGLATTAAVAAGAVVLSGRRELRRVEATHASFGDELFTPPPDVRHHVLDTHDGGSLHLVERGQGRPLVLLHGVTLRWDIWSPQLHQLADRFRVIALDLRGHGESVPGDEGLGVLRVARDLATTLEALDLRGAIVAGHSMGGMATMQFCVHHPDVLAERVAGLALIATALNTPVPAPLLALLSPVGARVVGRIDAGKRVPHYAFRESALSSLIVRSAFGDDPPGAAVAQVREMLGSTPPEWMTPSWVGLLSHDVRDRLADVHTPAAIVVGTRDTLTPVWCAREIARALPQAELHVLARSGHQVMQERPVELAQILDQLAGSLPAVGAGPAAGLPASA